MYADRDAEAAARDNVSSNWNNFAFGTVTWFTGDTLPSSLPGTSA